MQAPRLSGKSVACREAIETSRLQSKGSPSAETGHELAGWLLILPPPRAADGGGSRSSMAAPAPALAHVQQFRPTSRAAQGEREHAIWAQGRRMRQAARSCLVGGRRRLGSCRGQAAGTRSTVAKRAGLAWGCLSSEAIHGERRTYREREREREARRELRQVSSRRQPTSLSPPVPLVVLKSWR